MIGKNVNYFLFEEDLSYYNIQVKTLYKRKSCKYEIRLRHKNGNEIWTFVSTKALLNDKNNFKGSFTLLTDITERKRMEESLRESEERFRSLYENSMDAILLTSPDGSIYSANPAACKMFMRTEEEICKLSRNGIVDVNDPRLTRIFEERERTGKFIGELNFVRSDGTVFTGEVTSSVFLDKVGNKRTSMIIRDITERKLAEEMLHLEKENFRHSLDDSPLGVRIATFEGDSIYANKTLLNFYGYDSLEELQKTPLKNRYTPESYAQAQKRKRQRERGDLSTTNYEISIVRKNGKIRHLQVFRKDVLWNDVRQFLVICNDITEQKRLEEIMKKEQQEIKLIIDSSPIIIFYKDKEGKFIRVNKIFAEAVKLPEEELVGKTVFDLYSDKIAQSMTNDDQEVFKSRLPKLNIIEQYESASGIRWVQTDKIPICDINGIPFGLIGFAQDITESVRAKEALQIAEQKYRTIADYTYDWEFWQSPTGEFIYNSPSCKRISGYDASEFMLDAFLFQRIIHPEDLRILKEHKHDSTPSQPFTTLVFRIVHIDGSIRWIEHLCNPILDSNGKFLGTRGSNRDITERRKIEEALQLSEQRLQALSHLIEIQEAERKRIASELHDEIGQVLTAVQLNLHGIKQFGDLKDIPDRLDDSINLIEHSLQQVRDLAIDLRPWMLDQLGLIPSLRWYIDNQSTRTKIKVQFKADKIKERLSPDIEITCFRVVQEAFTNIHRHSQATKVNVTLNKIDNAIVVEISDNGVGFDVKKVRSKKIEKHGLGLIDMEERVNLINGTFNIESAPGKGTTITIRLPLDLSLFRQPNL
jgi:PAS domain S-box-containing protein